MTPLYGAALGGHSSTVEALVAAGANANVATRVRWSELSYVVRDCT